MKTNEQAEELSVTWRTPLGPMTGQISGKGIRELRFPRLEEQTLGGAPAAGVEICAVQGQNGSEVPLAHAACQIVSTVTSFLRIFFAGRALGTAPRLDLSGVSDFDRAVWQAALRIPRGKTKTYGQIAGEIGKPEAARAVGGALGRNPLVLLVPCHRVVSAAGGEKCLCGFTGGLELKRYLLALEGIRFED